MTNYWPELRKLGPNEEQLTPPQVLGPSKLLGRRSKNVCILVMGKTHAAGHQASTTL